MASETPYGTKLVVVVLSNIQKVKIKCNNLPANKYKYIPWNKLFVDQIGSYVIPIKLNIKDLHLKNSYYWSTFQNNRIWGKTCNNNCEISWNCVANQVTTSNGNNVWPRIIMYCSWVQKSLIEKKTRLQPNQDQSGIQLQIQYWK